MKYNYISPILDKKKKHAKLIHQLPPWSKVRGQLALGALQYTQLDRSQQQLTGRLAEVSETASSDATASLARQAPVGEIPPHCTGLAKCPNTSN